MGIKTTRYEDDPQLQGIHDFASARDWILANPAEDGDERWFRKEGYADSSNRRRVNWQWVIARNGNGVQSALLYAGNTKVLAFYEDGTASFMTNWNFSTPADLFFPDSVFDKGNEEVKRILKREIYSGFKREIPGQYRTVKGFRVVSEKVETKKVCRQALEPIDRLVDSNIVRIKESHEHNHYRPTPCDPATNLITVIQETERLVEDEVAVPDFVMMYLTPGPLYGGEYEAHVDAEGNLLNVETEYEREERIRLEREKEEQEAKERQYHRLAEEFQSRHARYTFIRIWTERMAENPNLLNEMVTRAYKLVGVTPTTKIRFAPHASFTYGDYIYGEMPLPVVPIQDLVPCQAGWHAFTNDMGLAQWGIYTDSETQELWRVELLGPTIGHSGHSGQYDKIVAPSMRFVSRVEFEQAPDGYFISIEDIEERFGKWVTS